MAKKEKELYVLDYSNPAGTFRLSEYEVPLPKMPSESQMVNYHLPTKKQKFFHTQIPKYLLRRTARLSDDDIRLIEDEYHKRFNGEWYLINGKPVYFPGPYFHFLNYWTTTNGKRPDFRHEQCQIYQFWDMVVRDPLSYGMFLVKPRRVGGTETALHIEYEYASRVRNAFCGMQSLNENTVKEYYKRLTRAHRDMIWYMKPIHRGSDDPDGALELKYPTDRNTAKRVRDIAEAGEDIERVYEYDEMGSSINYKASVATGYEGAKLNRYNLTEFGKLIEMSAVDCWDKVKPCLHTDGGIEVIGKAIFESTIEEINDEQIQEVNLFWKESNPNDRDANGRTHTGLYRLFMNALDCAKHDEYGFPKREEQLEFLNNSFAHLKKKSDHKRLAALKRKNPLTIEDALTPSGSQSAFNQENLRAVLSRIDFNENPNYKPTTRGNFIWAKGQRDGKVIWDPNPNGKFLVSQLLPDDDSNKIFHYHGKRYPLNVHLFRSGCDPYEHEDVVDANAASDGACVIMNMYDDIKDGAKVDDNGMPKEMGWGWKTKQPVCTYCYREDDPHEFFEDMIMAHVYYGTQMLVENNKQSIKKYFRTRGYEEYLMLRPKETIEMGSSLGTGSRPKQTVGVAANTDTISQYFMAIAHYVMTHCGCIKHREIILDLLEMNRGNRTKHDLGVAFGWCLLALDTTLQINPAMLLREKVDSELEPDWFKFNEV